MTLDPIVSFAHSIGMSDLSVEAAYSRALQDSGAAQHLGDVRLIIDAANRGSILAMCLAAQIYLVDQNREVEAIKVASWAQMAANDGFAPGRFLLAHCMLHGVGVPKDIDGALRELRLAAEKGFIPAAQQLALIYSEGRDVPVDMNYALHFASVAAEKNDSVGAMWLAQWYEMGKGIERNLYEALHWYRRASDLGNPVASVRLSTAYSFGELGLERNSELAEKYAERAETTNSAGEG
jgi:TPR repeat protein